ncbi:MAG: hypothetical protein ACRDQW_05880 [Haloechinothrix sp.]
MSRTAAVLVESEEFESDADPFGMPHRGNQEREGALPGWAGITTAKGRAAGVPMPRRRQRARWSFRGRGGWSVSTSKKTGPMSPVTVARRHSAKARQCPSPPLSTIVSPDDPANPAAGRAHGAAPLERWGLARVVGSQQVLCGQRSAIARPRVSA